MLWLMIFEDALTQGSPLMRATPGRKIAAVNAPQSRRFATDWAARLSRQRLECGGFSTAFDDKQDATMLWLINFGNADPG